MKYRDKLLELILEQDDEAVINWIEEQPLIEQPDILRELKILSEEAAAENGEDITELVAGYDTFDAKIDLYEDAILDEKLAEANLVMAQEARDKKMLEIEEAVAGVREYVMDCIINNEDNAEAMKELAEKMMQSEKDNDIFEPKNWSRIL